MSERGWIVERSREWLADHGTLVPFDDAHAPPTLLSRDDPYAPVAVDAQLSPVTPAVILAQNDRLASATLRVSQLQRRHEVVGQENQTLRSELLEAQEREREVSNRLSTIDQGMDWLLDEVADLQVKADDFAAQCVERGMVRRSRLLPSMVLALSWSTPPQPVVDPCLLVSPVCPLPQRISSRWSTACARL